MKKTAIRFSFSSIKTQLIVVLMALVALLVIQGVIARANQQTLSQGIRLSGLAVTDVSHVRALQRDILDLQRTVLLFRETASDSAVSRFERLMQSIALKLDDLETSSLANLPKSETDDMLQRMRHHLQAYQNNFKDVVEARARRDEQMLSTSLFSTFIDDEALPSGLTDLQKKSLQLLLSQARHAALQYRLEPDAHQTEEVIAAISQARDIAATAKPQDAENFTTALNSAQDQFLMLTQLIRGNMFLVNVVMAGSANEFLYLSNELVEQVNKQYSSLAAKTQQEAESAQQNLDIASLLAIFLAIAATAYTIYRILNPVKALTSVFRSLAKDRQITQIPGLRRKDEIGQLADAANVFRQKNQQTHTLLKESQALNHQQKSLNEALSAAKDKAEKATASKSIFLANMSHELRTPVNGIVGLIELAQQQPMSPVLQDYLNKASYSSQVLMSVINDVLDFSRIEAGKLDLEETNFSMHSLFNNLLSVVTLRAQEKNLSIKLVVAPGLPTQAVGDPTRISQVLLNLCSNAIKFTEQGEITLRFDGELNPAADAMTLNIEVKDTGIGMTDAQLKRVFSPFSQAEEATNRKYGGSGLGLAIVRQLVDLMNGELAVSSTPDCGTVFNITLPLATQADTPRLLTDLPTLPVGAQYYSNHSLLPAEYLHRLRVKRRGEPLEALSGNVGAPPCILVDIDNHATFHSMLPRLNELKAQGINIGIVMPTLPGKLLEKISQSWPDIFLSHPFTPAQFTSFVRSLAGMPTKGPQKTAEPATLPTLEGHVLLVEDNAINQVVTGEILSSLGLSYDVAEDGQQAVTKVENAPHYDLILMDVQMPQMDGYQATHALREKGFTSVPIVGLSANAMKEDKELALKAGMNSYITKPVKRELLASALHRYLNLSH